MSIARRSQPNKKLDNSFDHFLGRVVSVFRCSMEMTSVQLAHESNIDLNRLTQIESGETSMTTVELVNISNALTSTPSTMVAVAETLEKSWWIENVDKNISRVEKATPEKAAKDTFRILILDNIAHVNELKAACKNAGHSVLPAHTVKEAMAFLDNENYADVIVCAAYLEDEYIFEFLSRLRKHPTHKTSIFMILSLAPGPAGVQMNANVEVAGRHLGADAFISMPVFDAVQLITEISKLLPLVPWNERIRLRDEMG